MFCRIELIILAHELIREKKRVHCRDLRPATIDGVASETKLVLDAFHENRCATPSWQMR
jgi:hypothetical protein